MRRSPSGAAPSFWPGIGAGARRRGLAGVGAADYTGPTTAPLARDGGGRRGGPHRRLRGRAGLGDRCRRTRPFRVVQLEDPARIVIDVALPASAASRRRSTGKSRCETRRSMLAARGWPPGGSEILKGRRLPAPLRGGSLVLLCLVGEAGPDDLSAICTLLVRRPLVAGRVTVSSPVHRAQSTWRSKASRTTDAKATVGRGGLDEGATDPVRLQVPVRSTTGIGR